MSTTPRLYYTAYRNMAIDDFGRQIAAPASPPLSEGFVEISHTSTVSDPFPKWTSFIQIKVEADCHLAFANANQPDPEAEPDYHLVEAGEVRYYGASEGSRIAVIASI